MNAAIAHKINDFFRAYPQRHCQKGQILIRAHDDPTHIVHLVSGRVKEYDISYRGDEIVLNVFKPPAFFPMSYALNRTPNLYTFEAETDLELHEAPIDEVLAFLKANQDVLLDLLARVYQGTDGLLGRLAHLMAGTARSRVLYELLIESRRFGKQRDQGMALALTESDIGARAGLSRETVSREISKLKDDGLITVVKNELFVTDFDRLTASVSREL